MARGAGDVAIAEAFEVDGVGRLGLPLAQRGHALAVMGRHDEVEGLCDQALGRPPVMALVGADDDAAAEADGIAQLRTRQLPGLAELHPVIGALDLPAAFDALGEHPVPVAQAIAKRWQALFGKGVEKAGRESPQAAVAQRRVLLALQHLGQ
jgi:hypothetical protein